MREMCNAWFVPPITAPEGTWAQQKDMHTATGVPCFNHPRSSRSRYTHQVSTQRRALLCDHLTHKTEAFQVVPRTYAH